MRFVIATALVLIATAANAGQWLEVRTLQDNESLRQLYLGGFSQYSKPSKEPMLDTEGEDFVDFGQGFEGMIMHTHLGRITGSEPKCTSMESCVEAGYPHYQDCDGDTGTLGPQARNMWQHWHRHNPDSAPTPPLTLKKYDETLTEIPQFTNPILNQLPGVYATSGVYVTYCGSIPDASQPSGKLSQFCVEGTGYGWTHHCDTGWGPVSGYLVDGPVEALRLKLMNPQDSASVEHRMRVAFFDDDANIVSEWTQPEGWEHPGYLWDYWSAAGSIRGFHVDTIVNDIMGGVHVYSVSELAWDGNDNGVPDRDETPKRPRRGMRRQR